MTIPKRKRCNTGINVKIPWSWTQFMTQIEISTSDCIHICSSSFSLSYHRSFQNDILWWKMETHKYSVFVMSMCLFSEVFIPTECCGSCNTYRIQNDIFSFVQWWLKEIIVMNTKMNENSTCTLKKSKIFLTLKFKFSFVFFSMLECFFI